MLADLGKKKEDCFQSTGDTVGNMNTEKDLPGGRVKHAMRAFACSSGSVTGRLTRNMYLEYVIGVSRRSPSLVVENDDGSTTRTYCTLCSV